MVSVVLIVVELVVLFILARNLHLGFGRLFYKVTRSRRLTAYLLAVVFLPGTFIHEVAHFLAALCLLVPVGQVELMPEFIEGGLKLGSVPVGKADPVRRFLIGAAPIMFGVAIILGVLYFCTSRDLLGSPGVVVLLGYFVWEVGNTMFLSRKDLEGAWKLLVVILLSATLVFVAIYFLNLKISLNQLSLVLSNEAQATLKKANLFLAIPIIIDIVLVALFKTVRLI